MTGGFWLTRLHNFLNQRCFASFTVNLRQSNLWILWKSPVRTSWMCRAITSVLFMQNYNPIWRSWESLSIFNILGALISKHRRRLRPSQYWSFSITLLPQIGESVNFFSTSQNPLMFFFQHILLIYDDIKIFGFAT